LITQNQTVISGTLLRAVRVRAGAGRGSRSPSVTTREHRTIARVGGGFRQGASSAFPQVTEVTEDVVSWRFCTVNTSSDTGEDEDPSVPLL
jgi:hypothetical protein